MKYSSAELANLLNGKLEGDEKIIISQPARIEDAREGEVSFIANPKYTEFAYTTKASLLVVPTDLVFEKKINCALIRVADSYSSFGKILQLFNVVAEEKTGVEQFSFVDYSAKLAENTYVGSFAYIGKNVTVGKNSKVYPHAFIGDGCVIGENTIIFSGVKIYHNCVVGNHVIIHSGVVIGSDGFGFAPQKDGSFAKVPQLGNVIIENDVEIGSNTTIDRATMGSTKICHGVKLDNLVQIAHNVEIGEHTVIAAQTGVSGSTKIGKHCMIGGQVGFVGHITIADGTKINAQSGISKSITEPGKAWNGAPAFNYNDSLRSYSIFRKLPELEKRIIDLENKP